IMQRAQENMCAHRMGERQRWRHAHRLDDLFEEGGQVLVEFAKVADMGLLGIRQCPARGALTAPVERRDDEAAAAQLVYHLAVLLDEFRLAMQQDADAARICPFETFERGAPQSGAAWCDDELSPQRIERGLHCG